MRLDLSREGGDIVLRLSDDGAGMNVDRIRSKAIERGLMAADADLNDREILQYILEAGFSTAEKQVAIGSGHEPVSGARVTGRVIGMTRGRGPLVEIGDRIVPFES